MDSSHTLIDLSPPTPATSASATGFVPEESSVDPNKRRAPKACRICRQARSKCVYEKSNSPQCKACIQLGAVCEFAPRGDDKDRSVRHPRTRADKRPKREAKRVKRESTISPVFHSVTLNHKLPKWEEESDWNLLPDIELIKEGVVAFTAHFFQLGFIPKERFPLQLEKDAKSVSPFLLLSILSISARFNTALGERYGLGKRAVERLTDFAEQVSLKELSQSSPTLERCQAFFLLSIAQQGLGRTNKSYISMGIATRMAALMQLHREETYQRITPQSSPEEIVHAESARRTLWMLHSQDNLHSGPYKPVSLSAADITALLPCDEKDFTNGIIPQSRAALDGTPPAVDDPTLTTLADRSLFATLMQTHHLWGLVARQAVTNQKSGNPGDAKSEFATMAGKLAWFEKRLPHQHWFSDIALKGHRTENTDLAYLSCTMIIRLCNIVLRKTYMNDMIRFSRTDSRNPLAQTYRKMAEELFGDVKALYNQVHLHFSDNRPLEQRVGSQMAAFCVYSCGLLASYMCKFPQRMSPVVSYFVGFSEFVRVDKRVVLPNENADSVRSQGQTMYKRTVDILEETKYIWPLGEGWLDGLKKWYNDTGSRRNSCFEGGSMTDGVNDGLSLYPSKQNESDPITQKDPKPYGLLHPPTTSSFQNKMSDLHRPRLTTTHMDERRRIESEPTHLAPLQHVASNYSEVLPLPSISQAPYFNQQHSAPQPHYEPQQPLHTQQIYAHEEFNNLYHAGQHPNHQQQYQYEQQQQQPQPQPQQQQQHQQHHLYHQQPQSQPDPYPQQPYAYLTEYGPSTHDDFYHVNLKQFVCPPTSTGLWHPDSLGVDI